MKKQKVSASIILMALLLVGQTAFAATTKTATKTTTSKTTATTTKTKTTTKTSTISGTIESVSKAKITIKDKNKVVYTVNLSKAKITKKTEKGSSTIKVTDLKKGQTVNATGTLSGKSLTATAVEWNNVKKVETKTEKATTTKPVAKETSGKQASSTRPDMMPARDGQGTTTPPNGFGQMDGKDMTMGTITAINDSSIVIDSANPREQATTTFTILISSATVYEKDHASSTKADLATGDRIMVKGKVDTTNKTITAEKIEEMSGQAPMQGGPKK